MNSQKDPKSENIDIPSGSRSKRIIKKNIRENRD